MVRYEVVQSELRFDEVGPAWEALRREVGGSIFQSYPWIAAWYKTMGKPYILHVGLTWEGEKLRAVLPLVRHYWHGVRLLEWAAQEFSDYCDAIGDFTEGLWEQTYKTGGFDAVRLKNIAPDAKVAAFFKEKLQSAPPFDRCLQLRSRWSTGDDWFRTLNKKKRNNDSRARRMLSEAPGTEHADVRFRLVEENERLEPILDRLLTLKRGWITATNSKSPFLENDHILTALTFALRDAGVLRIFLIEVNGEIVAGSINAVAGDQMYAFFSAYSPAVERASPGITLMTFYTRWAFDRKLKLIDYLRGEETYKFEFATDIVNLATYIGSRTWLGRGFSAAYKIAMRKQSVQGVTQEVGGAYFTNRGTLRT